MEIRATKTYLPSSILGGATAVTAAETMQAKIPVVTGTTAGLFFQLPDMSASPKKVFAHLFGPYPLSIDNVTPQSDYWATQYLNPHGENDANLSTGGFMRDRPIPRPVLSGDFKYKDCASWVQTAYNAGLDGFFCNIMGTTDPINITYTKARDAANAIVPGFFIVPMIDASATIASQPVADIAANIATYSGLSSTYRVNNVMMIGTFLTEGQTVSWWQSILDILFSSYGITAKYIFVYNSMSTAANYHAIQYAAGQWGPGADANIMASYDPGVTTTHARGELALVPVWAQDIRSNSNWCEALNTTALRNSWDKVISTNGDFVQMCTWSDFHEGGQFCPSAARGQVALDISSYYITRWKTGAFPTIQADALYLSYRNHVSGSSVLGPQTQFMSKRTFGGGEAATRYAVEALVFLTSAATVGITIAGNETQFSAAAGISVFTNTVTTSGTVSARIIRSGTTVVNLAPPAPIRATVWVEDRQYFAFGSIRGTTGQFDPMFTSSGSIPTYP